MLNAHHTQFSMLKINMETSHMQLPRVQRTFSAIFSCDLSLRKCGGVGSHTSKTSSNSQFSSGFLFRLSSLPHDAIENVILTRQSDTWHIISHFHSNSQHACVSNSQQLKLAFMFSETYDKLQMFYFSACQFMKNDNAAYIFQFFAVGRDNTDFYRHVTCVLKLWKCCCEINKKKTFELWVIYVMHLL